MYILDFVTRTRCLRPAAAANVSGLFRGGDRGEGMVDARSDAFTTTATSAD